MKYAFVTISIAAIWVSITLVVATLDYKELLLPLTGLGLTLALFILGFGGKN